MAASLPMIALMTTQASDTASTYSSQRRGANAAEASGDYNARIFGINAELADAQAEDAIARGREAELRTKRAVRGTVGAQRASLAASGVDVSTGSARDIQLETELLGALDATTLRNNAAREAWGYRVEAAGYRAQAAFARYAGRSEAASLRNQSMGTLLTGAARLGELYSGMRARGASNPLSVSTQEMDRNINSVREARRPRK